MVLKQWYSWKKQQQWGKGGKGVHWLPLTAILHVWPTGRKDHIDGLMQERRNSIANALELHLSCTNPSIWQWVVRHQMRQSSPGWSVLGDEFSSWQNTVVLKIIARSPISEGQWWPAVFVQEPIPQIHTPTVLYANTPHTPHLSAPLTARHIGLVYRSLS